MAQTNEWLPAIVKGKVLTCREIVPPSGLPCGHPVEYCVWVVDDNHNKLRFRCVGGGHIWNEDRIHLRSHAVTYFAFFSLKMEVIKMRMEIVRTRTHIKWLELKNKWILWRIRKYEQKLTNKDK